MAFQRPFLISLKRADSSHRWGFGIKGGKDYSEPLHIQTVGEDSLAEQCGLRAGDEVIQVGRVNVQDLTLGQVYELLARCGNKIEMFVIREDLFSPRKGKEPQVVKAVVHNPYNSPLSLYSTENIADTLAKQTEVLTEGHVSTEEEDGPENLSFKQKSAVFQLLEEQAKQEGAPKSTVKVAYQNTVVSKPKTAPPPPPPPKPKPPSSVVSNGYESPPSYNYQRVQEQNTSSGNRVEYQTTTTQKVYNQYQYQQEQPIQYQQTAVYQSRSPGYQSPGIENQYSYQSSNIFQQQHSNSYEQPYQHNTHQQTQGNQSPIIRSQDNHPGYQAPSSPPYKQLNQINYQQNKYQTQQPNTQQQVSSQQYSSQVDFQQNQSQQSRPSARHPDYLPQSQQKAKYQEPEQIYNQQQFQQGIKQQHSPQLSNQQQTRNKQRIQQTSSHQQTRKDNISNQPTQSSVSKAEFKIAPPPPPRGRAVKAEDMAAVYKQQYEQHLQQHQLHQQMHTMNNDDDDVPKAHFIEGEIFEHNSSCGAPVTYQAPPVAPPKPNWPPPPSSDQRNFDPISPSEMDVSSVWPPRKSTATDLPRTGFNPATVREQGAGKRCVWPPQKNEDSGRTTPQSPSVGRRIQWNPSPSPPAQRRAVFGTAHSPARRRDIQWPPPGSEGMANGREFGGRSGPRLSRKAEFDDHVHQHASVNVPQTYRPPPGTQHVEYR